MGRPWISDIIPEKPRYHLTPTPSSGLQGYGRRAASHKFRRKELQCFIRQELVLITPLQSPRDAEIPNLKNQI